MKILCGGGWGILAVQEHHFLGTGNALLAATSASSLASQTLHKGVAFEIILSNKYLLPTHCLSLGLKR